MGAEAELDGRRARARESRRRATRAMLDLIRETGAVPTAEAVAERAQLSRRTVFRLVEDLDELRRSAVAMQRAEVMARFPAPSPMGRLDDDLDALIAHRAAVYEFVAPVRRVADRLEPDPIFREAQREARSQLRAHLEAMLGPHLPSDAEDREDRLDGAFMATSWRCWSGLRDDLGVDVARARRVVRGMVRALLAP